MSAKLRRRTAQLSARCFLAFLKLPAFLRYFGCPLQEHRPFPRLRVRVLSLHLRCTHVVPPPSLSSSLSDVGALSALRSESPCRHMSALRSLRRRHCRRQPSALRRRHWRRHASALRRRQWRRHRCLLRGPPCASCSCPRRAPSCVRAGCAARRRWRRCCARRSPPHLFPPTLVAPAARHRACGQGARRGAGGGAVRGGHHHTFTRPQQHKSVQGTFLCISDFVFLIAQKMKCKETYPLHRFAKSSPSQICVTLLSPTFELAGKGPQERPS